MSYINRNVNNIKLASRNADDKTWQVLNLLTHSKNSHHLGRSPLTFAQTIQQFQRGFLDEENLCDEIKKLGSKFYTECLKLDYEEYMVVSEFSDCIYRLQHIDTFRDGTYDVRTLKKVLMDTQNSKYTIEYQDHIIYNILNVIFKHKQFSKKWMKDKNFSLFFMFYLSQIKDVDAYLTFIEETHMKYKYPELRKVYDQVSDALSAYDSERN